MIDPVEDCVSRALQRHADKVPLGRDVSGPAIQRALQIRRRRRAAGAVAGLALLGGLIPVGVELAGPPNDRAEVDYAMPNTSEAVDGDASVADPPTGTTRPSVPSRDARDDDRSDRSAEPTEPEPPEYGSAESDPVTTVIDFVALPTGAPPEVPYFDTAAGEIVDGETRVRTELTNVTDVVRVSGGYAVQTLEDAAELFFVGPDGKADVLSSTGSPISSFAASVDGKRLAWLEDASQGNEYVLVVVELTGDGPEGELHSIAWDSALEVIGFVRDAVVLGSDRDEGAAIWNPADDAPTWLDGTIDAVASDGIGYVAVVTGEDDEFRRCSTLVDAGNGNRDLWGSCEDMVRALSPGGHYAVTVDPRSDGYADAAFQIVDGPSGQPFVIVGPGEPSYFGYSFERSGAVLIEAEDDGQHAIVRCLPNGECEFATPPMPFEGMDSDRPAPYALGR